MHDLYRILVREAAEGFITPKVVERARNVGREKYLRAFDDWMDRELHKRGILVEMHTIKWMEKVDDLLFGKVPKAKVEEYRHELVARMFANYDLAYAKGGKGDPVLQIHDPKEHPPQIENFVKAVRAELKIPTGKVENPSESVLVSRFIVTLRDLIVRIRTLDERNERLQQVDPTVPIVGLKDIVHRGVYDDLRGFAERTLGQKIDPSLSDVHQPPIPKGLAMAARKEHPPAKDEANLIFFALRRHVDDSTPNEIAQELGAAQAHVTQWLARGLEILGKFFKKHPSLLKGGADRMAARVLARWAGEVGYAS